ncbi:MAG: TIGR03752 family integrating conjugative element protein [Gammaproteobacteria bacterium]|nr:TIGR03752 family integrating conjugative element protein [Gammaproteobacteria bacterium]
MPAATANRLLPLLGGAVVLMLVFVTLKSCSQDEGSGAVLDRVPTAPAPDADTPADTIKTLTANVAAMTTEVEALRRENATLARENQNLVAHRTQIEENVATRLRRELLSRERDAENQGRIDSGVLASLTDRVDRLAASVARVGPGSGADIPVGLGLDGLGGAQGPAPGLIWVEPLDAPAATATKSGLLDRAGQTAGGYLDGARTRTAQAVTDARDRVDARKSRPAYTVPRNATLMGSTAMTALVGRIPIQGQVRDPMPFKVITGSDNLAANGLTVPGVQGMVWSGTAVGDWTLSCVTGRLESVTFVFDDGTIRTISSDDRSGQVSGRASGQGGRNEALGWISDPQGIPCISGERKTNAASFLTQRIGVQAIQAAADAAAAAETTSVISDLGSVTDSVTGDVGTYMLGKTVAGGSEEVAKWLLERQSQSFDAVFVPAGTGVAIHVDRELAIDFHTEGRKLNHARSTATDRHHRLD